MTDCPDCGEDHETSIRDYYTRAAEAVVAASTASRAELNELARETLAESRKQWPDVADKDLQSFLQSQAMLVEAFSRLDILELARVLDVTFANCTLAAASLADAYDLTADETPKQDVNDILADALARHRERMTDDDREFPGNYL